MTPAPRNPSFGHKPEVASCYAPVRSKPIPTDPNGRGIAKMVAAERSLAGNTLSEQPIRGLVESSPLPLKKRAASDTSSADDTFVVPAKKRRADAGSDGTSAYGIPARTYDTVTVCATAALPEPSSSNAITVLASRQPPQQQLKKLMHDGIRSGGVTPPWHHSAACDGYLEQAETSAAGAARAKNNTNTNAGGSKRSRSRRPPTQERVTLSRKRTLRPSEELSRRLEMLGATTGTPHFVCRKNLSHSDVKKNQNRLLISCKAEFVAGHPITALYAGNEKETFFINEWVHGLQVITLDGHGRKFAIKLKYLGSNGGYRLIGEWGIFVEKNELDEEENKGRRVDLEVWAFRSRSLPGQPRLKLKDKNKDKEEVERLQAAVDALEDHPDGALGLLFIPYVDGVDISNGVYHAEEEIAGEEMAEEEVAGEERVEEEWEPAPAPVHETKRQASAKAVREEKRIADRERANRGKAVAREEKRIADRERANRGKAVAREEKRIADRERANRGKAVAREMTIAEVIEEAGEELGESLIGLLTLSAYCSSRPSSNAYAR